MHPITLRKARPTESEFLTQLALRSKAYWGYDEEFMKQVKSELKVTLESIEKNRIIVAEQEGKVLGFYELKGEPPLAILNSLFVDPLHIEKKVGQILFQDAVNWASAKGYTRLCLDSDPFAQGFYEKMGMKKVGEISSKRIPGRYLPLMEISLRTEEKFDE